jgi:tRNA (cytidine/uridine-2'-O-)-methyltransferase
MTSANHTHPASTDIHVVLVEPLIPHNTGAIGRLCVGLSARLHLVEPLGFSLCEKAIRRSGLDYWENLDLKVYPDWDRFLQENSPDQLHFLSTRGTRSLYEITFTPPCWLAFGNEAKGLPPVFYERYAHQLYKIPQPGEHARSINLANAAAIAMYECYRQIAAASSS